MVQARFHRIQQWHEHYYHPFQKEFTRRAKKACFSQALKLLGVNKKRSVLKNELRYWDSHNSERVVTAGS